jgi:guanidinopropionase
MASKELTGEALFAAGAGFQHWSGVATFLRCPHQPDMSNTDIGLIGFPYSGGNSVERMQYLGPRALRNRSMAYRRTPRDFQIDPFAMARVTDLGDVPLPSVLNPDLATKDAEVFYRRVHELGIVPITVGGDHSITTPILRAMGGAHSRHKGPMGMIHFDAHSDTYPEMGGTRHHAGAAFRIGVEENLIDPARTIQIGFHGPLASPSQDNWSRERFTVVTLQDMIDRGLDWVASEVHRVIGKGPAYLSFDLDVIDIAYAPAVADPEVNGMTTRELFALLNKLRGVNLAGADIVCFCPPLDTPAQITALTASEILLKFVAHVAEYKTGPMAPREILTHTCKPAAQMVLRGQRYG